MLQYEQTPSRAGTPSVNWPTSPRVSLNRQNPTLLMFVHPHCPCTRASLHELSLLMTRCQGAVDAYVIAHQPPGTSEEWVKTDLFDFASQIPGVSVLADRGGLLAKQFEAETSGETVVYDTSGKLRFHGGITASRGHQGDNVGRSSVVSLLTQNATLVSDTCVFGCSLNNQP